MKLTDRQRQLAILLGDSSVDYWSYRDLCDALALPYTRRYAGEVGRDVKWLGYDKRRLPDRVLVVTTAEAAQPRTVRRKYAEQTAARKLAIRQSKTSVKQSQRR